MAAQLSRVANAAFRRAADTELASECHLLRMESNQPGPGGRSRRRRMEKRLCGEVGYSDLWPEALEEQKKWNRLCLEELRGGIAGARGWCLCRRAWVWTTNWRGQGWRRAVQGKEDGRDGTPVPERLLWMCPANCPRRRLCSLLQGLRPGFFPVRVSHIQASSPLRYWSPKSLFSSTEEVVAPYSLPCSTPLCLDGLFSRQSSLH